MDAGRYAQPIAEPDENDLIAGAQAGDRQALDQLLRRHYDRLYAVCRRICANEADALDAAQEALISVSRAIARFDRRASFSTWSYRIAVNASLDELRRRRRRPDPTADRDAGRAISDEPGVSSTVADRIDIDRALARVTPEFRAAVVLRDLCGMDYAEIASVLELPAGTVRSRIARGRAQLADILSGNHHPADRRPTTRQ